MGRKGPMDRQGELSIVRAAYAKQFWLPRVLTIRASRQH